MNKSSDPRTRNLMPPTKEVMTPKEAAEYLSVHVRTLYRLVKKGAIPGRRVGGSWRFQKHALDEWLSGREILPLEDQK